MTDVAAQPRVRRGFLRASVAAFFILLPFVIHSAWDYIESRRLKAAVDAIVAKGEPIAPVLVRPTRNPDADAERFYRAGAALAYDASGNQSEFGGKILAAQRTGEWTPELVDDLRQHVRRFEEATRLADRASGLPFHGFPTTDSLLNTGLASLARELSLRGLLQTLDGDGDAAVESLFVALQMQRPFDGRLLGVLRFPADFAQTIERTTPDASVLAKLAQPLAAADSDEGPRRDLLRLRTLILDQSPAVRPQLHWEEIAARPLAAHFLVRQLDAFSALFDAVKAPWPDRIDRVVAVGVYPMPYSYPRRDDRAFLESFIQYQADRLASIRCSRVAVAIERYRIERGGFPPDLNSLVPEYLPAVPGDPFTGRALLLARTSDAYTVYSVGRNRRDDGGTDLGSQFSSRPVMPAQTFGADTGIRIRLAVAPDHAKR